MKLRSARLFILVISGLFVLTLSAGCSAASDPPLASDSVAPDTATTFGGTSTTSPPTTTTQPDAGSTSTQ